MLVLDRARLGPLEFIVSGAVGVQAFDDEDVTVFVGVKVRLFGGIGFDGVHVSLWNGTSVAFHPTPCGRLPVVAVQR